MTRCKILLADEDLSYLAPLELALLREFDEKLEISMVTDPAYLRQMFSTPQRLDVVIMNERLWDSEYRRHDIGQVFLLSEDPIDGSMSEYPQIYKYTSEQDIVQQLDGVLQRYLREGETSDCREILVYSPQGGSGKTTLALGLAASLAALGSRVLYVDAEPLQDFPALSRVEGTMDETMLRELQLGRTSVESIANNTFRGSFHILRPMRHAMVSCGLSEDCYEAVLRTVRAERLYDFVIVDTSSSFDSDKVRMLMNADYVIIPLLQNAAGASKLRALFWNLDLGDREKYIFVCNAFREGESNHLLQVKNDLLVSETIPWMQSPALDSPEDMRRSGVYMGLAYRFL